MPANEQQKVSSIEPGDIIPMFTLPGPDGMPHSPWDYKQRDHLVLLFTRGVESSETCGLLRAYTRAYPTLREDSCAVLAITLATVIDNVRAQESLNLPFPLLADPRGEIISRYTYWDQAAREPWPCIVLSDRYNALYQRWLSEQEADLPPIEEILESLRYINKLCTS